MKKITGNYDFSQFKKIIEFSSGKEIAIADVLAENPDMEGVLYLLDTNNKPVQGNYKVADYSPWRIEPGEIYVLNSITEDYGPEKTTEILTRLKSLTETSNRIILIEPDSLSDECKKLFTVNGFVMTNSIVLPDKRIIAEAVRK